jgi:membrane protease YdiL (CAAX protease family)
MSFRDIFINRFAEIRVGWRLLMFLSLLIAILFALGTPLRMLGIRNDLVGRIVALVATLGASYLMTRFVNKKPFGAIGLSLHPNTFREFGVGCLLGFLMMSGIFIIEFMSGYAHLSWRGIGVLDALGIVGWGFISFTVAAFLEETLYRGYFFQTLIQGVTFLPAMLLMSLLFAFGHFMNPQTTPFSLINIGLAGVWLSIAYMKTRSLWLPFGLHVAWNFSQTSLYAFPTSGISFGGLRLFDLTQSGPVWITGGAFGPEGGALATLALIVCTWYILKSEYLTVPEGIVTLDSVEDLIPRPEVAGDESA